MKKTFSTMLAFCAVALLLLGGCSGTEMTDTQTPVEQEQAQTEIQVEKLDSGTGGGKKPLDDEDIVKPPSDGNNPTGGNNPDRPGYLKTINFEFDRDELTAEAKATLQDNYDYLVKFGSVKVTIEGHCDERGSDEYNIALGQRRAAAARDYLVNLGLDKGRFLEIISHGENVPLDPASTEEAWKKNRRAEFTVQQ